MKINLFTNRALIVDYEEEGKALDLTDDMLDKLDDMLTAHNIHHAFTLPMESDLDNTPYAQAALFYYEEDKTAVFLILALWLKTVRKASEVLIKTAMRKHASLNNAE